MSYITRCYIEIPSVGIAEDLMPKISDVIEANYGDLAMDHEEGESASIYIGFCREFRDLVDFLKDYTKDLAGVMISMESFGEEFGDHCKYYFMDGKVQEELATFAAFDPTKLVSSL